MNLYCVVSLVFSFLVVPIDGNCEFGVVKNPGCRKKECENIDINMIYSNPCKKQQLVSIVSTNDHEFGALITEHVEMTMNYSSIINLNSSDQCDKLYKFGDNNRRKSRKAIGIRFYFLPLFFYATWSSVYECRSDMCAVRLKSERSYPPGIWLDLEVSFGTVTNLSSCQDGNLFPTTLRMHFSIEGKNEIIMCKDDYRYLTEIMMSVFVPSAENFSLIPFGEERSIIFGNIEDPSGHPSMMIEPGADFVWEKDEYRMTTEEINVRTKNLPIDCFFKAREKYKAYHIAGQLRPRLPEVELEAEIKLKSPLTWSVSINLGNSPNSDSTTEDFTTQFLDNSSHSLKFNLSSLMSTATSKDIQFLLILGVLILGLNILGLYFHFKRRVEKTKNTEPKFSVIMIRSDEAETQR